MATVLTQTYSSNTAITIDLSSLAASASFTSGRESTQVDNTTNMYDDVLVNVKGITAGATALVVGQTIAVYVWGADTSLATTAIDTLVGSDGARSLTHASNLNALRFAGAAVATETTANRVFYIQPFTVAPLFGGVLPKFWGLYVAHSHAGALAAGQTGKFSYNGITYTNT